MSVAELRAEIHTLIDEIDDEETVRGFLEMLREILKERNASFQLRQ
jgi:hypothetical protein